MARPYLHYDVFTDRPFTGNQLAVFPDARGLETARMQAIAREIGFSETTFVAPAEVAGTSVRMRIFTPTKELPMAGHPTIGSTFALADIGVIPAGQKQFVFGLGIGPTPVALEWSGQSLRFAWMTQVAPSFGRVIEDRQAIATALGVAGEDVSTRTPTQQVSCGVPFLLVPMSSREAVDRAACDASALARFGEAAGIEPMVFLFSLEQAAPDPIVYSRMFAPGAGVPEDPATGGASGPLGSYLVEYGLVAPGDAARIVSNQGVAMGRPSRIHIAITGSPGAITDVKVGGQAVFIARGELVV